MEPIEHKTSLTYMMMTKLHPLDSTPQQTLNVLIDVTLVKTELVIFVLLVEKTETEHQIVNVSTDITKPKDLNHVNNVLFNV